MAWLVTIGSVVDARRALRISGPTPLPPPFAIRESNDSRYVVVIAPAPG
jgi:hypothetical protein